MVDGERLSAEPPVDLAARHAAERGDQLERGEIVAGRREAGSGPWRRVAAYGGGEVEVEQLAEAGRGGCRGVRRFRRVG